MGAACWIAREGTPAWHRAAVSRVPAMPAYVIVETNVTDSERYEQYKAAASAAIGACGGRYLARGGELTVLEGDWQPSRLVVPEDRHSLRRTGGTHNIRYSAMRVTSSAAPVCRS